MSAVDVRTTTTTARSNRLPVVALLAARAISLAVPALREADKPSPAGDAHRVGATW